MNPVMGTLNDWHLVKVTQKTDGSTDEEEIALLFEDALQQRETEIEGEIVVNGMGIIKEEKHHRTNPNGYQLVEWMGEPYPLQTPTILYGCGSTPMSEGSMVAEVRFWDRIPNLAGNSDGDWFEKPRSRKRHLIWLREVITGAVDFEHPSDTFKAPADCFFRDANKNKPQNKILITTETIQQKIRKERHRLEKWDAVE